MKSSLAFMGTLAVALATGTLITKAIETHDGTQASHPSLFAINEGFDPLQASVGEPTALLAPDPSAIRRVRGLFMPNLGQKRQDVYFHLLDAEREVSLRAGSIAIQSLEAQEGRKDAASLVLRFVSAQQRPEVVATAGAPESLVYDVGSPGSGSRVSVPLFSEIEYRGLYDGIDVSLRTDGSALTQRFLIHAGAVPSDIMMHYEGGQEPLVLPLPSAALEISVDDKVMSRPTPTAFQDVDGLRMEIPVTFAVGRYGVLQFNVGDYDLSLPLVIDVRGV